jgi:hypothetical protein
VTSIVTNNLTPRRKRVAGRALLRACQVVPIVGTGALLAHLLTAAGFRRRIDYITARLESATVADISRPPVPAIIKSFVHRSVPENAVPRPVRLSQCGAMRANPGDAWRPFTAEQVISVYEPGFVWLARMPVVPLLSARILDCYVGGEGLLEARLLGSLPLARSTGPETSMGELMRYLAELAWAPHAMLHNSHLSWREIDAATVEVSAESAGGRARVRLVFEHGDVARVEADDRPRLVGSRTVPTPWRGHCSDYCEMDGCRIPTRAKASWLLEEGPFDYWRG